MRKLLSDEAVIRKSAVVFILLTTTAAAAQGQQEPETAQVNVDKAELTFTLQEHDLYPESIAYDPVTKDYFLSSLSQRRIIRIHENGSYEDFMTSPPDEHLATAGMKVDAERRVLWACTGRFSLMANSEKFPARTGVLKYSIEDGKLLESWILDEDMASAYHIFNDLTVATNGDVYVTTTLIGRVYKISEATGKMELLLQLKEGSHNNGIDLGPNEKYLFLTVDRSIYRYDLATGEMVEIINPSGGEVLIGTDGLYFYENSLIAVKPRYNLISRIHLKEDLLTVDHVDILVQGHPEFSYPTTGVVADDTCVVVATSFVRIPRNAESTEQHPDVKIYSVPLEVH